MSRLLIDTNLLLLWVVGSVDRALVSKENKTLSQFEPDDLDTVLRLAEPFSQHVSTPNVLTETSNLLGKGLQKNDLRVRAAFSAYCASLSEIYVESAVVTSSAEFQRFGLADVAVLIASKRRLSVLTADHALAGKINSIGGNAINFWHSK